MFKVVIFDWDGTLADTRDAIIEAFQRVLHNIGCHVTDEFLERQIGIGARNMLKNALKHSGIEYDESLIDRLLREKIEIHLELTHKIKLFEGVTDLLKALKSKVKIALATMSNRRVIEKILAEKGIMDYFDIIITADEIKDPKPNPEIFLKCAEAAGCKPEECVVIEDSIFGVMAAKRAGMRCIAIPSGFYSKSELKDLKPDLIVESIKEKNMILKYILGGRIRSRRKCIGHDLLESDNRMSA